MFRTLPRPVALVAGLLLLAPNSAVLGAVSAGTASAITTSTSVLTLADARRRALEHHPLLTARKEALTAQQAGAEQASLLPNPVLSWSRQNLNNDRLTGTDGPADSVQLSQLIELGGKRGARTLSAQEMVAVREQELAQSRADVLAAVRERYVDASVTQARIVLLGELLQFSERTEQAATERVRAGKVAPLEQTKATIALAGIRTQLAQAARELDSHRLRLVMLWGESSADFSLAELTRIDQLALPEWAPLQLRLPGSPLWRRWDAQLRQREAELDLAKAKAIPDLTFSVGRTTFSDLDESSDQVGLSLQLPLFDRYQGGRAEAHAKRNETRAEAQAAQLEATVQLRTLYQRMEVAQQALTLRQRETLPGADEVFRGTVTGYQAGKFSLLEVLDAQRTLFELREQQLNTIAQFHHHLAALERLLGTPLTDNSTLLEQPQ